jgi:holo-[acyl-carrier protein] synthase
MILGVGMDIVEIGRIEDLLRRFGSRFVQRVFTGDEIAYCEARSRRAQHYAVRFAAKEAFVKALGQRGVTYPGMRWSDICVQRAPKGEPSLTFEGSVKEAVRQIRMRQAHLSLSHSKEFAAAVVILET